MLDKRRESKVTFLRFVVKERKQNEYKISKTKLTVFKKINTYFHQKVCKSYTVRYRKKQKENFNINLYHIYS